MNLILHMEHNVAQVDSAERACGHRLKVELRIDRMTSLGDGEHSRSADVFEGVAFLGVGSDRDLSGVDELEPPDTEGGQMHGDLPTDAAQADDGGQCFSDCNTFRLPASRTGRISTMSCHGIAPVNEWSNTGVPETAELCQVEVVAVLLKAA